MLVRLPNWHGEGLRSVVLLLALLVTSVTFNGNIPVMAVPSASPHMSASVQADGPWTNFSTADGLAADSILALDVTTSGHLWVGTTGGVSIRTLEGDWLTLTDADGLASNVVMDITPDPTDTQRRWFATDDGGSLLDDGGSPLDKTDDSWITFDKDDGLAERYLWTVAVDDNGDVWFGTNRIDENGDEHGYGISVLDLNGTPFSKADDTWITYTTTTSDLSHNVIHDIVVDEQGVVWVATASGLNAYSGDTWTVYYTSNGLPSNNVTALLVADDLLWVATTGGVGVLDCGGTPHDKADDQWSTYTQYNSGLVDNDTSSLAMDDAGRIWIGTVQESQSGETGSGISVLDPNGTPFDRSDDTWATFTTYSGLAHNAVRKVAAVGSNVTWIGTKEGLSCLSYGSSPYDSSDNRWTTYTASGRLAGNSVYAIAEANLAAVWLGTDQGLSLLQHRVTPHIKRDDHWITFTTADGLAADRLRALAVDDEGRVWSGTAAGLTVLDTRGTLTYKGDDIKITYDSSNSILAHDQVNDIAIDSAGRAWIACGSYFGGGLHVLDVGNYLSYRGDDTWATFTPDNSELPNSYVTTVALGSGNHVWLGTYGGAAWLNHAGSPFNKGDDTWTVFTTSNSGLAYNTVRDVALDQAGNIWLGLAAEGVSIYSVGGSWFTFTQSDGLAYDSVQTVAVDRSGDLWLGTDGGGVSVLDYGDTLNDKNDDTWTTYKGGEALLSSNIEAIAVDGWGQIWLGAFGGGASVYSTVEFQRVYLPVIARKAQ
jgi:two-component system sensor histidine kinase ChiS